MNSVSGATQLLIFKIPEKVVVASPPAPPSATITRTSRGLIVADDFTDISDWDSSGVFTNPVSTILTAYPIPRYLLEATPASPDANGVRESHLVNMGNGLMYLFYGAGDGSAPPGGYWKVQAARSEDYGKTFTKLGVQVGLSKDFEPGDWSGRDVGFVYKYNTTYYLHVVDGLAVLLPPYEESVYVSTDIEGPWTYSNRGLARGVTGSYDDLSVCGPSVLISGSVWNYFYSAISSVPITAGIGYATAPSPTGTWSRVGEIINAFVENPKVFWSDALDVWVMLANHIEEPGGSFTDQNWAYFSPAYDNWAGAGLLPFQFNLLKGFGSAMGTIPCDIDTTQGDVVGLASPMYLENGIPDIDGGIIPFTYDAYPTDGNHNGRRILAGVLEQSKHALYFSGAAGQHIQKVVSHSDFVAEFTVYLAAYTNANGQGGFHYRREAVVGDTQNGYQVTFIPRTAGGAGVYLGKFIGGAYTNILTSTDMQLSVGLPYRIRIEVSGDSHKVYVNNVLIISATDAEYASGESFAFKGYECTVYFWNFHARTSNIVTIVDAPGNIWMHTPGKLYATEHQTALDYYHYPMRMLKYGSLEAEFADGIYGGDTYEYIP